MLLDEITSDISAISFGQQRDRGDCDWHREDQAMLNGYALEAVLAALNLDGAKIASGKDGIAVTSPSFLFDYHKHYVPLACQQIDPDLYEYNVTENEAIVEECRRSTEKRAIEKRRTLENMTDDEARKYDEETIQMENNIRFGPDGNKSYIGRGFDKKLLRKTVDDLIAHDCIQFLKQIKTQLQTCGIECAIDEKAGSKHTLTIQGREEELSKKLSALMDQNKQAILQKYGGCSFVIVKPDGQVLDESQGSKVIAKRMESLNEAIKSLQEIAKKMGLTTPPASWISRLTPTPGEYSTPPAVGAR